MVTFLGEVRVFFYFLFSNLIEWCFKKKIQCFFKGCEIIIYPLTLIHVICRYRILLFNNIDIV